MIDIRQALYNVMHSRYGRDVRTSIHDAIYQINENALEALQNAKTMGVGTAVTSPTSSSEGYVAGNLYLNAQTWDLWQCVGVDSWVNMGNIKGGKGDKGVDGVNSYIHIRYSQNYDGTDFTASPTAASQFIGFYYGSSATAPTNKQDYQWTSYVGAAGTSAYVHIRYSENADGADFVSEPTANTKYIGIYAGTSSSAPANKAYYTWSEYVGKSGTGTGDMLKTEYAGKGIVGTVDKADEARVAGSAETAAGLKTEDGETLTADEVSAKITKVGESADWLKSKNLWNLGDIIKTTPGAGYAIYWLPFSLDEGTYSFSCNTNGKTMDMALWDEFNGNRLVGIGDGSVFTLNTKAKYITAYAGDTIEWTNIQLEKGSTVTPYQPYSKSNVELTKEITAQFVENFGNGDLSKHYKMGSLHILTFHDCSPSQAMSKLNDLGVNGSFPCLLLRPDAVYVAGFLSRGNCFTFPTAPPYENVGDNWYVYGNISIFL